MRLLGTQSWTVGFPGIHGQLCSVVILGTLEAIMGVQLCDAEIPDIHR